MAPENESNKANYTALKDNMDRMHLWLQSQQETIGNLRVDQGKQEVAVGLMMDSIEKLLEKQDKQAIELAKLSAKMTVWGGLGGLLVALIAQLFL